MPSRTRSASREARVEVAGSDLVVGEDVVADERVEDRRQVFRPDGHAAARGPECLAVGGREEDERLGVVLDLATDRDEDRLVVADEADDVVARDVGRGDDGDLRPVERGVEVEGDEPGVGVGRADRRAEPGAGKDEVVGVLRLAGELVRALAAQRAAGARAAGSDLARADDERICRAPPGATGVVVRLGGVRIVMPFGSTLLGRDDSTETGRSAEVSRQARRADTERHRTSPHLRSVLWSSAHHRRLHGSPPIPSTAVSACNEY